jgi:hypothetical protein
MENPAVMFRVLMNARFLLSILVVVGLLASCVEPTRPAAIVHPPAIGNSFVNYGTVALHQGQPCASQIMYDFRGAGPTTHGLTVARSTVWLAAPLRQSRLLTEAANCNCLVHVSGAWRRGLDRGCRYVQVLSVDLMK